MMRASRVATVPIIAATAGGYARVQYFITEGAQFDPAEKVTPEMVAEAIGQIAGLEGVDDRARVGQARGLDEHVVEAFLAPEEIVEAADEIAAWESDVVLNGMAGAAGLTPTLTALQHGKTLALANKESLIIGGDPNLSSSAGSGGIGDTHNHGLASNVG